MRFRHLLSSAAVCGALVIAGCGDDEDTSTNPAGSGGTTAPSGDVVAIDIKNIEFMPKEQTVKVGQTVEWTNSDDVPHNVIAEDFKSDNMEKGDKFTYKAEKAGEYDYVCTIHSGQNGKLIVEG